MNDEGAFTFTPESGFVGDPTPIEYMATSMDGTEAATPGTVSVDYSDVAPTLNDAKGADVAGAAVEVTPAYADKIDLAPVKIVDAADDDTLTVDGGKWSVANGVFTFTPNTPNEGFTGKPEPIKYTASTKEGPTGPVAAENPGTITATYTDVPPTLPPATGTGSTGQPVSVAPDYPANIAKETVTDPTDGAVSTWHRPDGRAD